jgi:hypothetical protein
VRPLHVIAVNRYTGTQALCALLEEVRSSTMSSSQDSPHPELNPNNDCNRDRALSPTRQRGARFQTPENKTLEGDDSQQLTPITTPKPTADPKTTAALKTSATPFSAFLMSKPSAFSVPPYQKKDGGGGGGGALSQQKITSGFVPLSQVQESGQSLYTLPATSQDAKAQSASTLVCSFGTHDLNKPDKPKHVPGRYVSSNLGVNDLMVNNNNELGGNLGLDGSQAPPQQLEISDNESSEDEVEAEVEEHTELSTVITPGLNNITLRKKEKT